LTGRSARGLQRHRRGHTRADSQLGGRSDQFDYAIGTRAQSPAGSPGRLERRFEDTASPIHDRMGRVSEPWWLFRDVSSALALAARTTASGAADFLTELPNRMLLRRSMVQAVELARREGTAESGADSWISIRFKHVQDSLGHVVGDECLQSVADRRSRASDIQTRSAVWAATSHRVMQRFRPPDDAAVNFARKGK